MDRAATTKPHAPTTSKTGTKTLDRKRMLVQPPPCVIVSQETGRFESYSSITDFSYGRQGIPSCQLEHGFPHGVGSATQSLVRLVRGRTSPTSPTNRVLDPRVIR